MHSIFYNRRLSDIPCHHVWGPGVVAKYRNFRKGIWCHLSASRRFTFWHTPIFGASCHGWECARCLDAVLDLVITWIAFKWLHNVYVLIQIYTYSWPCQVVTLIPMVLWCVGVPTAWRFVVLSDRVLRFMCTTSSKCARKSAPSMGNFTLVKGWKSR